MACMSKEITPFSSQALDYLSRVARQSSPRWDLRALFAAVGIDLKCDPDMSLEELATCIRFINRMEDSRWPGLPDKKVQDLFCRLGTNLVVLYFNRV